MTLPNSVQTGDPGHVEHHNAIKTLLDERITAATANATYVAQVDPSTTNKRLASRYQPVFDASFEFSKISTVQDGLLVWSGMNVSAGTDTPITYFKAVGGSINHSGPGNLDVFWSSVAHSGPREAGLFIGDITSTGGGNTYGVHTRLIVNTTPCDILVGYENEVQPNVARGPGQYYYNEMIQNTGTANVSAGIQFESPATGGGGKFDVGINFDSTAASLTGFGIRFGGVWGAGIDMNNNAIVGIGSLSGIGSAPTRQVRIADKLALTAPGGTLNKALLFTRDNGGKTELVVQMPSGSEILLASEA